MLKADFVANNHMILGKISTTFALADLAFATHSLMAVDFGLGDSQFGISLAKICLCFVLTKVVLVIK